MKIKLSAIFISRYSIPRAIFAFTFEGDEEQKGDGHPGHRGLRGVGGHLF
jgi:hypothetical protein